MKNSVFAYFLLLLGDSDSDDYSPVCSEDDEKDFPLILPGDEGPSLCHTDSEQLAEFCLDDLNENIEGNCYNSKLTNSNFGVN